MHIFNPQKHIFVLIWEKNPLTDFLSLQWVPDVAVEVIITCKDKAARVGQGQGCDAGVEGGVGVGDDLLVGAQVVHLAGAVVGACDDDVPAVEELKKQFGVSVIDLNAGFYVFI